MPSRRQSLLILGGVGTAALAGGAYLYERQSPEGPYDPVEAAPPERPIPPPSRLPAGDAVDWRPQAPGFTPADDKALQIKGYASATSVVCPASCKRATSHSQYSVASIAITTGAGTGAARRGRRAGRLARPADYAGHARSRGVLTGSH